MNVISNRELHLREFERRQQYIMTGERYPKKEQITGVIIYFDEILKKKNPDIRVSVL